MSYIETRTEYEDSFIDYKIVRQCSRHPSEVIMVRWVREGGYANVKHPCVECQAQEFIQEYLLP